MNESWRNTKSTPTPAANNNLFKKSINYAESVKIMCISFHYFEEQATAIILDADTGPANTRHSHFYMLQRNDETSHNFSFYLFHK